MPSVRVNDVEISEAAILAESQNHPASTPERAVAGAAEALVVRALLLQQAEELELALLPRTDAAGRRETDDEALVRQLLEIEVTIPEADEDSCRRYYDNNRNRFRSADLYEAAHILFACDPKDTPAYDKAVAAATKTIAVAERDPAAFAAMARERSDCSSGKDDGLLGQITRGDTVPEFETFLVALEEGQLCPVPVKSRYGVHVLRLDKKIAGRDLPFAAVRNRIANYLHDASWRRAVSQYIKLLAGQAAIDGIDFDAASTPLVR